MEFWKEFLVFSTDNKTKIAFVSTKDANKSWLFDIPWETIINNKKPKMFLDKFENLEEEQKIQDSGKQELKELSVINISVHESSDLLTFTATDKTLFLCKIHDSNIEVLSRRSFQRTSSVMKFSHCGKFIFLADKTGDTFEYSCENFDQPGRWIFGHLSQILDLQIKSDLKYIITSDRDEKIRVTNYPETHEIESYCLGHTEFVSSIGFIKNDELLITSSGDKTLRIWQILTGKELQQIELEFVPITMTLGENFLTIMSEDSTVHLFRYKINDKDFVEIEDLGKKSYSGNINVCQKSDIFYVEYLDAKQLLIDQIKVKGNSAKFEIYRNATEIFNHAVHDSFAIFKYFEVSLLFKKKYDNIKPYIDRKKARIENEMAKKMKIEAK